MSQRATIRRLKLTDISVDPTVHCRTIPNRLTSAAYAAAMRAGAKFPAVDVFWDGKTFWLSDGFLRVEAAQLAQLETIQARVRPGTRREAILHAISANVNRLRSPPLTTADKKKAVLTLVADQEWGQWSSREIGRHCGVDGKTVEKYRRQWEHTHLRNSADGESVAQAQRRFRRGGSTHLQSAPQVRSWPSDPGYPRVEPTRRVAALDALDGLTQQIAEIDPAEVAELAANKSEWIADLELLTQWLGEVIAALRAQLAREDALARSRYQPDPDAGLVTFDRVPEEDEVDHEAGSLLHVLR